MKKAKRIIIPITLILSVIMLTISISPTSVTVANTNDNSAIKLTNADAKRVAILTIGRKVYFETPGCIGSNIELQIHTNGRTKCRTICGDDCGTIWDKQHNPYYIPDRNMKRIKDILSHYDIEVTPQ